MPANKPLDTTTSNPGWGAPSTPVVENVPVPSTPKGHSRRMRLDTAKHVRAELVRVYKSAKAGDIKMDYATKFAYILELLSRQIERTDLEQRLIALEAKANSK